MVGKHTGANYDLAKAEADKVDAQIMQDKIKKDNIIFMKNGSDDDTDNI